MKKNPELKSSTPLNKPDLIASVVDLSGLSKEKSTLALDALIASLTKGLNAGKSIRLFGLGTFKVVLQQERDGRNPKTGASLKIPAKKVPKFSASQTLKKEIA